MKTLFYKINLFFHLIPKSILILTVLSMAIVIGIDIYGLRLPIESENAVKINTFWTNLLYAVFTSGIFFALVYGVYDYRRANLVSPFIVSKVRELLGYINGNFKSMCDHLQVQYELGSEVTVETMVNATRQIDFRTNSHAGIGQLLPNGQLNFIRHKTWYEHYKDECVKVLELCNNSIDSANSLNLVDMELLEQLYFLKTSPFLDAMINSTPAFQMHSGKVYMEFYYDLLKRSYNLELYINKHYGNFSISVERFSTNSATMDELIIAG